MLNGDAFRAVNKFVKQMYTRNITDPHCRISKRLTHSWVIRWVFPSKSRLRFKCLEMLQIDDLELLEIGVWPLKHLSFSEIRSIHYTVRIIRPLRIGSKFNFRFDSLMNTLVSIFANPFSDLIIEMKFRFRWTLNNFVDFFRFVYIALSAIRTLLR